MRLEIPEPRLLFSIRQENAIGRFPYIYQESYLVIFCCFKINFMYDKIIKSDSL